MVTVDPHGVNDGSGDACATHSYASIDGPKVVEQRLASLRTLLSETYGVQNEHLVTALCALGEGAWVVSENASHEEDPRKNSYTRDSWPMVAYDQIPDSSVY